MLSEFAQSFSEATTIAMISLVLAVAAFAGIVVWALRVNESYTRRMSELPLDENEHSVDQTEKVHL